MYKKAPFIIFINLSPLSRHWKSRGRGYRAKVYKEKGRRTYRRSTSRGTDSSAGETSTEDRTASKSSERKGGRINANYCITRIFLSARYLRRKHSFLTRECMSNCFCTVTILLIFYKGHCFHSVVFLVSWFYARVI